MNQSMGMADFFSMEAGDYLERLDALVSGAAATPDTREFIRLSRALRGSAIMAGQQTIANVAAGLEALSRGVDEARIGWNEAARQLAIRAVDDMKVLVRAVPSWGNAEDARAQAIVSDLEHAAGRSTVARRVDTNELDSGTRAFIAREGAAVGSALDRAARSLALNTGATDPLESVLRAMQPLRGIASLSDLPPLPDLLEGIERAIGEVSKHPSSSSAADIFDKAAKAVSRAAQEIATTGKADPESQEAMEFAEALGGLFDSEAEVVPIESLYHDDNGPHIVAENEVATTVPLGQLELVSHAEYLRQFADDLERARSNTQRTLRAHALAPTLRSLASGAGGGLTAEFARAVRDAVARGAAVRDPERLAHQLRAAGIALSESGPEDGQAVHSTLQSAIQTLATLALDEAPEESLAFAEQSEAPPEVASGYETMAVNAPLATLDEIIEADQAPQEVPTPFPAAAAATAVANGNDDGSLAGAFSTLFDLEAQSGTEHRPITDLVQTPPVSEPTALPVVPGAARVTTAPNFGTDAPLPFEPEEPLEETIPAPALASESGGAQVEPPSEAGADDVVPISQFCYTGTSALRRAISLRHEVRAALEHGGPQHHLAALIEEIFDLVQLGIHRPT